MVSAWCLGFSFFPLMLAWEKDSLTLLFFLSDLGSDLTPKTSKDFFSLWDFDLLLVILSISLLDIILIYYIAIEESIPYNKMLALIGRGNKNIRNLFLQRENTVLEIIMKGALILVLVLLFAGCLCLPYTDQIALTNSLIVGREEDLKLWICAVCQESNKPIHSHYIHENRKDIKCIISVYPAFAVLAFRYTNSLINLWEDVLYPFQIPDQNTCQKCRVQKEYNSMWNSIRKNVTRDLIEIRNQTGLKRLYITGISLGGGLAGVSFVDIFADQIFPEVKVVTFGAPKVGNKQWAQYFDKLTNTSSRRFIVQGDPIVLLPACLTPLCNYKHAGIRILCTQSKMACTQEQDTNDIEWGSVDPDMEKLNSLVDHIKGYPKIYRFTLLLKGMF